MARKRREGDQELPFVALMDTMTNVVGVLTIVLVMMGISLGRAASRVFSSLPPATEEQIRDAKALLDRMRAEQAPLQKRVTEPVKLELTPAKLAELEAELADLKRALEEKGIKPSDLDGLTQDRAKQEAELKQKKVAIDKLMAERDRLKALLDNTPVVNALPVKIVRIPASRPIPEGAEIERVVVTQDGPHWIHVKAIKASILRHLKSPEVMQMALGRVKRGNKVVVIYDYEQVARYFKKEKLAYHEFKIDMTWVDWSSGPVLRVVPEGPSPDPFPDVLEELKRTPKTVVMFMVTGYGFDSYLAARKDCETAGVPAGWEYARTAEYTIHLSELETNKPKPPPPPTPPKSAPAPPPKPSSELQIKPPAPKLD